MNKIDLASKPDAPLHYLRFRWSSRKCGDRIRKINVAPVLQKQLKFQTCFASFFFFFFARRASLSPKFLQKELLQYEMDDHLWKRELLYILMIFARYISIIFHFQLSNLKTGLINLQILVLHLEERIFHILIHTTTCD